MDNMEKLVALNIREYMDLLGSDAPAPGGGSASALVGAQGVALCMMVAALTVGKERYKQYDSLCKEALEEGEKIKEDFMIAIDKDTKVYSQVTKAFKMAKSTEEEKTARSEAIQIATVAATRVPLEIMEFAIRGINLAEKLIGQSNPNCSSDIGVGVINLKTALQGAWLNVLINLPGIKDQQLVEEFRAKGRNMVGEGCKKADDSFLHIEKGIE